MKVEITLGSEIIITPESEIEEMALRWLASEWRKAKIPTDMILFRSYGGK